MAPINTATQNLESAVRSILCHFDDPARDGLRDTPSRVARMYAELLTPQHFNFTMFDADGYDEMVIESGIEFFSLCEHHLVPFFGTVSIGYIPNKRLVGLSKLARTVEFFARRLQVQERLTDQISDFLHRELDPVGVGVVIRARHLCQEMRGVKKRNVYTVTSAMRGAFLTDSSTKQEFIQLCQNQW